MPTPRLWSWELSPFAGKVRVAFAEKGVPLDLIEIDPRRRRLGWELNPTNRVPVLELDGTAVRESTAICEWLEDTHPGRGCGRRIRCTGPLPGVCCAGSTMS